MRSRARRAFALTVRLLVLEKGGPAILGGVQMDAAKGDEPACAGSEHLQVFPLSLVHQRGGLFKLVRRHALSEKGDDVLHTAFIGCERVKWITNKEQIALDDPMRVEDRATRIKAVWEDQRGAFIVQRPSATGEQCSGAVMDRDSEPAARDALRRETIEDCTLRALVRL